MRFITIYDNSHVVVYFPYDAVLKDLLKELFLKKVLFNQVVEKKWTISLQVVCETPETLKKFLDFCEEHEFAINPTVLRELKGRLGSTEALKVLSKAKEDSFEVDGLKLALRPYQKAGVKYATTTEKCLIGDSVRLRKDDYCFSFCASSKQISLFSCNHRRYKNPLEK